MLPKYIAQIIVSGAQAVGRAFARAVREEVKSSRQAAARDSPGPSGEGNKENIRKRAATNTKLGLTFQEARQILHVSEKLDPEEIQKRFDHLFAINDKSKGGSLYIQSKVFRAKERLDAELKLRSEQQTPKDNAEKT